MRKETVEMYARVHREQKVREILSFVGIINRKCVHIYKINANNVFSVWY